MKSAKIRHVTEIDPSEYKSMYKVGVDIGDFPTMILVGVSEALGFETIEGGDVFRALETDIDLYREMRIKITEQRKTV